MEQQHLFPFVECEQYINMLHDTINRMAANSANCKTWMVTIVTAFMALQCSVQSINGWVLLGLLPVILFWYLDAMYLKLERGFRNREREFINAVCNAKIDQDICKVALYDFSVLYKDKDDEMGFKSTKNLWLSKSVFPFYIVPFVIVLLLSLILNWQTISGLFCK